MCIRDSNHVEDLNVEKNAKIFVIGDAIVTNEIELQKADIIRLVAKSNVVSKTVPPKKKYKEIKFCKI